MEERELEERCFEMFPEHPMLKMRACLGIMEKEEIDGDGIRVLQDALDSLPVKELYQQKMLTGSSPIIMTRQGTVRRP